MPGTHVVHDVKVVRAEVPVARAVHVHRKADAAYQLLRVGFALLPIIAGLDKFFQWLTSWEMYLSSSVEKMLPVSAVTFMRISGVVEIAAGVLVAVAPKIGAWVVAGWLAAITANLLIPPGFYDIALRDFGLMLGAISLGLLARKDRC
jgi:uncharacterized membrane protein YphA (DoxX/SURF4 family)